MKAIDSFIIIEYIKESVEMLMNLKMEEFNMKEFEDKRKRLNKKPDADAQLEAEKMKKKKEMIDQAKKSRSKVMGGIAAALADVSKDTESDFSA